MHECVDAACSEFLAQRMGLCDEALERMPVSEATIQTTAHGLGDFLRLSFPESCSSRGRASIAFLASSLHVCSMTMNNGSKLLEFCRCSSGALEELGELVTGTQEGEVLLALYECDFDGAHGSANAGIHKESTECFRVLGGRHGASNSRSTKFAKCPARTLLPD